MNETVAKIVELLFQDVEMNDEVKAIHDEVMNNCQERFGDLLNRGLDEDEAIAAVVESLKGMEEVLAGYPRKAAEDKRVEQSGFRVHNAVLGGNGGRAAFSAQGLRRVSVNLLNEDLTMEPSPDDEVHVVCNLSESDKHQVMVTAELVNGELRVTREKSGENRGKFKGDVHIDGKDIDFFAKDFSFESLGDMLGKLMRNIQINFDGDERVCIQVPTFAHLEQVHVQTTSGNVGVDGVITDVLDMSSRSGDLRIELSGSHRLDRFEAHTISGDVEAWLSADRAVLQSMSGDMRFVGAARVLDVSSTSGDVTVEMNAGACEQCKVRSVSGDVECTGVVRQISTSTTSGDIDLNTASETVSFSTVSGDIGMTLQDGGLRAIDGRTTSGDVNINLPSGVREADMRLHSISGDVSHIASVSSAPLRIAVNTVSDNIRVR